MILLKTASLKAAATIAANFKLAHGKAGLMHRESSEFPRCVVMSLNINVAFKGN